MRKKFIYVLWALVVVILLVIAFIFTAIAKGRIGHVPPIEELDNPNLKFATEIISDDGKMLGTWSLSKENRVFVGYDQLSPNLIHALIATEDERFAEHSGIDARAFIRALVKRGVMMQKNAGGGSTITQQLAKNQFFTQDKKIVRKIAEMFMAFKIESVLEKDKILELYVNSIFFGNNYYCVGDAAEGYCGKTPSEMNFDECTLLAGIPNAPTNYNPQASPELARQRQAQVIEKMKKAGYLKEETQDE